MCGILFTNDEKIEKKCFLKALETMVHRGPDAPMGCFHHENILMGHNRLKVIDLDDRSNQPFFSSDNNYVIVYNGEIYNHAELAREFELPLRTKSDTEILLELYIRIGPDILNILNGMFAFVIFNLQTKEIFAARDRLGIKPLYYSSDGERITFASEIAAVVKLTGQNRLDEVGLRQYRKLRTFFNGHTVYSGINMFPAAHYYANGQLKRYWDMPEGSQDPPSDEELEALIFSAVRYRCISDVPVGSYLSGGLDSTIIANLADKPHTWTVGFENHNEFSWARLAVQKDKRRHREVLIDEDEFIDIAEDLVKKRQEPLSVPNEVLIYKMTKEVKVKNTVILSGEGADELFFGYDRIFRWAADNEWDVTEFDKYYSYGTNDDVEIVEDAVEPFLNRGKTIDIVAAFFQIAHLHGLLRRLDFNTMQCSVEGRVPFVDHRLVELMAGVAYGYRMKDNVVKAPLKRIFEKHVPIEIINRRKVGFPVPLNTIRFPDKSGKTPMDHWLVFNIKILLDSLNLS